MEESVEELIEKIQETKDPVLVKKFSLLMGFYLHEKESIHFILQLILNVVVMLLCSSMMKGLIDVRTSLHVCLAVVILTILELVMKKIIISKFPLVMLYTAGQIFTLGTILFTGLLYLILPGFGFQNVGFFLIFMVIFCLLRTIISVIVRKVLAMIFGG